MGDVLDFMRKVVASYARHAPQDSTLVFEFYHADFHFLRELRAAPMTKISDLAVFRARRNFGFERVVETTRRPLEHLGPHAPRSSEVS